MSANEDFGPGRPPRLPVVFQSYDPPFYFVTMCIKDRRPILANKEVHSAFQEFARQGYERFGVAVGRYVIMPDHLHVFVRLPRDRRLDQWARILKRHIDKSCNFPPGTWQDGFFDHLIRNAESYAEKWAYVEMNPVRAGLTARPEDWPFQGQPIAIRY